jgi:hypothetical protein
MSFKCLSFIFPRELTVEEEQILIKDFQNIITGIKAGLDNAIKLVNSGVYKFIDKTAETRAYQYIKMKENITDFVILDKPEKSKYLLKININDINTFNFNMPGSREQAGDRLFKRFTKLVYISAEKLKFKKEDMIIESYEEH